MFKGIERSYYAKYIENYYKAHPVVSEKEEKIKEPLCKEGVSGIIRKKLRGLKYGFFPEGWRREVKDE